MIPSSKRQIVPERWGKLTLKNYRSVRFWSQLREFVNSSSAFLTPESRWNETSVRFGPQGAISSLRGSSALRTCVEIREFSRGRNNPFWRNCASRTH